MNGHDNATKCKARVSKEKFLPQRNDHEMVDPLNYAVKTMALTMATSGHQPAL